MTARECVEAVRLVGTHQAAGLAGWERFHGPLE
jgi:hypothetical protein